ncbi:uncharacterized protein LOC121386838 [Gigantopelta aegis]|uniref:uncharacterized protein LOC121386838 n=1 Tax=Gigantopelta aegis TaxID=1735272 RepID=UPI001B88C5C1|nr:uncharacterized protein LOC121386838 [Gigantopelta aegis]
MWENLFLHKLDKFNGYVSTLEEALDVIKHFEITTTSKFALCKQSEKFGCTEDLTAKNHRVVWSDTQDVAGTRLVFDGCPYMVLGKRRLECQNGPNRHKKRKEKQEAEKVLKTFPRSQYITHFELHRNILGIVAFNNMFYFVRTIYTVKHRYLDVEGTGPTCSRYR